jgi:hypothetical protein
MTDPYYTGVCSGSSLLSLHFNSIHNKIYKQHNKFLHFKLSFVLFYGIMTFES